MTFHTRRICTKCCACNAKRTPFTISRVRRTICTRCHHLTQPRHAIRKNTQHHMSKVLHLPRKINGHLQSAAPAAKNRSHLLKAMQKYLACHTERLLTHYCTRRDVTKCQTCHTKWRHATLETSKSGQFCSAPHRHGHRDLMANGCGRLRTVAKGCGRLRTVQTVDDCGRESSVKRTRPNPLTPKVKRESFATHSENIHIRVRVCVCVLESHQSHQLHRSAVDAWDCITLRNTGLHYVALHGMVLGCRRKQTEIC